MNGDNLATSANSSVRSFSGLTGGDTVDISVFGDWICSGNPGLLVLERVVRDGKKVDLHKINVVDSRRY